MQKREQEEVEAILASGILAKSPNLERFFRYVTKEYLEGRGDQIKEFNIAVEAFGRPETFDPKRDSIVRVEAYRLRKRLEKYYTDEGWEHEIHIHFPAGRYTPEFRRQAKAGPPAGAGVAGRPAAERAPRRRVPSRGVALLGAAIVLVLAVALYPRRPAPTVSAGPPAAVPAGRAVRILAGSVNGLIDQAGNEWGADRFFDGGQAFTIAARFIRRTHDRAIYLSRREGNFSYDIPLSPGTYELHLYFAETQYGEDQPSGGGEANRFFSIQANGRWLVQALDVVSDAGGGSTADMKIYTDLEPAEDGRLHLGFVSLARDKAFVNAIEVVPGTRGRMLPIRMVAGIRPARDAKGNLWAPESFSAGGQVLERQDPVAGTPDVDLYRHERFGHFSYAIPVAAGGRYSAAFRMCEQFFGERRPGNGGPRSRVFDVYCNGRTLLDDFDILGVAPPLHAVTKTFTGLRPNAQGKLVFDFVPVRNYPLVNAFEITEEGR